MQRARQPTPWHALNPRLQAKLAAEEAAASRRASTTGASLTFKGAARGVLARLRSSLELGSYARVQRVGDQQQGYYGGEGAAQGHYSGYGDPRSSGSRLPLMAGPADAVVLLARSSRVMPTPRGGSGAVPAINMELVHELGRAMGGGGDSGGGGSPRVFSPRQQQQQPAGSPRGFSPRQSVEMMMGRRSNRVSAEGPPRRGSLDLQQGQGQGQGQGGRWSGEYEQAPGGGRRDSNRVSLQQVRPSIEGPATGSPGRARFSQTFAQEPGQQQGAGRAGASPRGSMDYGAARAEAQQRRGGAAGPGSGRQQAGARFSQQLDGLV
jgi:hypothetical protein